MSKTNKKKVIKTDKKLQVNMNKLLKNLVKNYVKVKQRILKKNKETF